MRQNTRKFKPDPSNNSRHNVRSSSIRDIIGDRRFNSQFTHVNTHGTEGIKKIKRKKVGDAEADDLPNLGRNASSIQCEATEDPSRCCGDFAAKTSEYAFFKRMKENTCSNMHIHPKYHDNQLNNDQQSDHFTSEEIPNMQKESIKYGRSSLPIEKERDDAHYSFLSPPCSESKNSEVNNAFGAGGTNAQKVRPGEYNWFSPSVGSKTKASVGNKGVFSAKREKLRQLVADKSLYEVNELSSKGFDLVSVLISRILPEDQENNCRRDTVSCQVETDSRYKLPSFSELEAADTVPCQVETYSRYKLLSFSELEAATQIKDHEARKRKLIKSHHISYLEDDFARPTRGLIDMDLLEWDPTGSESSSAGLASKSSIQYNRSHTEGGFRIPDFAIESILSFDEPLPRYESSNFRELDESHFHNEPKLLEQPRTLLLGWDHNSDKDEFQLSAVDLQTEINAFSTSPTSQDGDYQLFLPKRFMSSSPSSPNICLNSPYYHLEGLVAPYIDRHLEEEHFLASSTLPCTPKHVMPVENCSINLRPQDYTWSLNESLNEKEHRGSESFLFLIQSPADNLLRFLNTGLHSFVVHDNKEKNFLYSPDDRVKAYHSSSYMEPFPDEHFDHIGYPLLLYDSSRNE